MTTNEKQLREEMNKARSKFEKMMGDAWEKYDGSSEFDYDLEEYGEDYRYYGVVNELR